MAKKSEGKSEKSAPKTASKAGGGIRCSSRCSSRSSSELAACDAPAMPMIIAIGNSIVKRRLERLPCDID